MGGKKEMSQEILPEDVNQPYQVLVWHKYEWQDSLGCPAQEIDCATEKEAYEEYNKVEKFMCKMLMKYAS